MKNSNGLTHLNRDGRPSMVDVSEKESTKRSAEASGVITVGDNVMSALREQGSGTKGDVFNTAVIAGIQAAKRTSELIPLCHPVPIGCIDISFRIEGNRITSMCRVCGTGKTGFEMEALTGVSVSLLTVYDMTKALDRRIEIGEIRLLSKDGGKSGEYTWRN
jgi:cyclic pyranopterin phosphate synthase